MQEGTSRRLLLLCIKCVKRKGTIRLELKATGDHKSEEFGETLTTTDRGWF